MKLRRWKSFIGTLASKFHISACSEKLADLCRFSRLSLHYFNDFDGAFYSSSIDLHLALREFYSAYNGRYKIYIYIILEIGRNS